MMTRFAFNPRLHNSFFREFEQSRATQTVTPAADVRETDKTIELRLDVPGVTPEKIDVKLEGNRLTITAERDATTDEKGWLRRERATGNFERSFTLDETLVGSEPAASYKHGVLTVTIPKREEQQPRSLKVKVEA